MEKTILDKSLRILNQLEQLGCPCIENLTSQTLGEFLVHPSEARVQLLSWVVSTYDFKLGELIGNSTPVISGAESRQKKMLHALNIMGVCEIEDLDVVRGTASQKKQIKFWVHLVDLLYTSERGHPYTGSELEGSFYLKPVLQDTMQNVYKDSCKFIDALVRQYNLKDLLSTDVKLFSREMNNIIKEEKNKIQKFPSLKILEEKKEIIKDHLETLSKDLDDIDCTSCADEIDITSIENHCRKLDLSLKTYAQISDNFLHCYDSDIKSWCVKREDSVFMSFGDDVRSALAISSGPIHLMESISTYIGTSSFLCNEIKGKIHQLSDLPGKDSNITDGARNILNKSITRKNDLKK